MAIDTKEFYDGLVTRGLDFFTGVPDSLLKNLCACITENTRKDRNIIAANEGNALGMACGYHLSTGKYGVVYMQNSGEGNIVNPLLSIADPDVYSIPMLLLIGWRGEPGRHDEPQHVKQGKLTCDLLDCMGVPYEVLGEDWEKDWAVQLDRMVETMKRENRAVALVVRKDIFSDYPFMASADSIGALMTREEALKTILSELSDDDFVVSTTGKTSREIFEIREARGQSHANDFLTVGGMGHTSSIAFGFALGTDKNVWCVDGDGSFLMHMGAFPVIAQNAPANFKYILNNNGAHESVGGQPTVGQKIDVCTILKASGFENVFEASDSEGITKAVNEMRNLERCALVLTTRQGSRADLGRPTTTPQENKMAIMEKVASFRSKES